MVARAVERPRRRAGETVGRIHPPTEQYQDRLLILFSGIAEYLVPPVLGTGEYHGDEFREFVAFIRALLLGLQARRLLLRCAAGRCASAAEFPPRIEPRSPPNTKNIMPATMISPILFPDRQTAAPADIALEFKAATAASAAAEAAGESEAAAASASAAEAAGELEPTATAGSSTAAALVLNIRAASATAPLHSAVSRSIALGL